MSNEEITLTLEKRDTVGKGLNKLKQAGKIPAVIHNHGKDSIIVSGDKLAIDRAYSQAGKHHAITLNVGKEKYLTIIKDVDFEPKKHQLRHVVFNAIKQDEKVEAEVPIVFEGDEIPAEKIGLIVLKPLDHVVIEALPKDLIDSLTVDITVLAELGDKLHVSDLKVPEGVTIKNEPEQTIAAVEQPRAALAEEAEEAEGEGEEGEGAEGEAAEGEKSEGKSNDEEE